MGFSNNCNRIDYETRYVLALGCFDGVHLGHKEVISTALSISNKLSLPLRVVTFEHSPRNFFRPGCVPSITTKKQKETIFKEMGAHDVIFLPLEKEFLSMDAQIFIKDILIDKLCAAHIVCGYNYTFGHGGEGNPHVLSKICQATHVPVTVVQKFCIGGIPVSSSSIREAIQTGDMSLATKFLGRPFCISATVVDGQHLATKLGFPTANAIPPDLCVIPQHGVYATKIAIDGNKYNAITNIGMRPTTNKNILCAESHIFDYSENAYGKEISIEFIKFIRREKKFDSFDKMSEQVKLDIEEAKEYFAKSN